MTGPVQLTGDAQPSHSERYVDWFLDACRRHATLALDAGDGDAVVFFINAGMATEFALKASVAAVSPVLLASPRSTFESMLHLERHGPNTPEVRKTQTRGLRDLAKNSPKVDGRLRESTNSLEALIQGRNAAVHLGTGEGFDVAKARVGMYRVLSAVLKTLGRGELRDFLPNGYGATAEGELSEALTALQGRVQGLITAAKRRFEEWYPSGLPDPQIVARFDWDFPTSDILEVECPACGTKAAYLRGEVEGVPEGDDDHVHVEPVVWPEHLRCQACRLELQGTEEFEAAGVHVPMRDLIDQQAYQDLLDEEASVQMQEYEAAIYARRRAADGY